MLNKLLSFIREYNLLEKGDQVTCAVSGGADSIALLFALYLLRQKLEITLSAAHFNHRLRGEESEADAAFVRDFCAGYHIPLFEGTGDVVPGKKGLEAAARDARYAFLKTLPGKIATAHTADDNAETVLMHLVRGTGLKGLGGIAPKNGSIVRPMLSVTRQDVLAFLQEYHLRFVTDSSNDTDDFLRNRLRHHVIPLLYQENPRFGENTSATALRLRQDEKALSDLAQGDIPAVSVLRKLPEALRSRYYTVFLENCGIKEPEAEHLSLLHKLVMSDNPSAGGDFPGGVRIARNYEKLEIMEDVPEFHAQILTCPGVWRGYGMEISCAPASATVQTSQCFTVKPQGKVVIRSRREGDAICLSCGTKRLKKLFIEKKIPASKRNLVPVIADDLGVIGVGGIGASIDRISSDLSGITITIKQIKE